MSTSSRKVTWLFQKNAQLRDEYLMLKRTWNKKVGKEKL